jgi:hypothetical protein
MTGILLILILAILIIVSSIFGGLLNIGEAGGSPSKLISSILKINSDKELADSEESSVNNDPKLNETIRRWRLAAGILFGIVIVFLLLFYKAIFTSEAYSWLQYPFWLLISIMVIVFIILSRKEKKLKK